MPRPRIGITTSFNEGEQRVDHRYVQAIERAGGLPIIIPMLGDDEATELLAGMLDGLVVTGGPAVVDGLVGSLPDDISPTDPVRLASDKRILASFLNRRKPVLGICYGMQLANALNGGQIYADVEQQKDGSAVHSQKRGGTVHDILVEPETILQSILGTAGIEVNTRHIQAIMTLGSGYRIAALAPDAVIEAIESIDGAFIGVQFHPEQMGAKGAPLFSYLVDRAKSS